MAWCTVNVVPLAMLTLQGKLCPSAEACLHTLADIVFSTGVLDSGIGLEQLAVSQLRFGSGMEISPLLH